MHYNNINIKIFQTLHVYRNPTPYTSDMVSDIWTSVTNSTHLSYMNIDTKLSMKSIINIEQQLCGGKTISKL